MGRKEKDEKEETVFKVIHDPTQPVFNRKS
jgi:hypothetical protein